MKLKLKLNETCTITARYLIARIHYQQLADVQIYYFVAGIGLVGWIT